MVLTAPPPSDFVLHHLPALPRMAPQGARDLAERGFAALDKGRYKEALEFFIAVGKLKDFENASYFSKLWIALTWRKQGEFSKALKVLNEALGLGDDRFVLLYVGTTLHQMKRYDDALNILDKVKEKWPEDPDVWVYRIPALMAFERLREALESAEKAFPLRHKSSDHGKLLFEQASGLITLIGYRSATKRWLPDLEASTYAFIKWRERARRDRQLPTFQKGVQGFREILDQANLPVFEEFMLGVRLMSIRDPFKAWKALGKEISKDWPEDVTAVQAIREQRRW